MQVDAKITVADKAAIVILNKNNNGGYGNGHQAYGGPTHQQSNYQQQEQQPPQQSYAAQPPHQLPAPAQPPPQQPSSNGMYQTFFIDTEQKFANHSSGLISFEYPIVDTTQCLAQPVAEEPGVYDKADRADG